MATPSPFHIRRYDSFRDLLCAKEICTRKEEYAMNLSFLNWLWDELVNDEIVDPTEVDIDEVSKEFLLTETECTEEDYENYKSQFSQYCATANERPEWDVEE